MAKLTLSFLGGFEARPGPGAALALPEKSRALLAYLALRPGQPHPRQKLATLLWGETADLQARQSLRQALTGLRRALGPQGLREDGHSLALEPDAVEIDVVDFEKKLAEGTAEALEQAVAIYQGDLLEGLDVGEPAFEQWLATERERLRELAVEALARLLAHQMKTEAIEPAIRTAGRLLGLDPLQEAVHRTLMRLYARQERRAAALRQYQLCVGVLRRELGVEPEAETKQLYQEVLQRRLTTTPPAEPRPRRRAARSVTRRAYAHASTSETRLVGRDGELQVLRHTLAEAWRQRGRVVAIRGEAGVGKTRLVEELAAEALARGGRVLVGRCYESERVLPFGAWVSAIRAGNGLAEVQGGGGTPPVWQGELTRLFPELGTPGLELSTAPENVVRLFEAVARLVEQLVSRCPLVLILEDLHWADEMSLRLLAFLARRLAARPLLVAATAREEDLVDAPVLRDVLAELDGEQRLHQMTLPPLACADTQALVRALATSGVDERGLAELSERVWAVSGGNPFVVVELMRALPEDAPLPESSRLPLPQRVRDVVARRLERLSDRGRELTAVAAVIGRAFDFPLLQRASGLSEAEAAAAMEELVRRRVFQGLDEGFEIAHDRIREVAYAGLLSARRQALHAAVGRALEERAGGDVGPVADQLAYHFSKAGHADEAIEYLTRSAEQAVRRYAHEEAVRALAEAGGLAAGLPGERGDRLLLGLVERQVFSLFSLGRAIEAVGLLFEHRDRVDRVRDPRLSGPYYFWLSHLFNVAGLDERAVLSANRALDEATQCGDTATMGRTHYVLALNAFWAGRGPDGVAHGQSAVELLRDRPDQSRWLAAGYWGLGMNHWLMGEFDPALAALTVADTLGRATADPLTQSSTAGALGLLHAQRGDWDLAVATCERRLGQGNTAFGEALVLGFLGYAYVEKGDSGRAIPLLEQSLQLLGELKFLRLQCWCTTWLGEAQRMAGRLAQAKELAVHSVKTATEVRYRYVVGCAQRTLGVIALDEGRLAEAAARLDEALQTFAAIQARYFLGRTQFDLARLARAEGHRDRVAKHLAEARDLFSALKVPAWVERCERLGHECGVSL